MSEGYQFQVNVWQPSPDTKPVVERHVVHGRVVELGPNWVAEQPPQTDIAVKDGRQSVRARNRRSLLQVAACWQHIGFGACHGEHEATYDVAICREIFDWLGLDEKKPTSHGTRRPACMTGAIAAYLAHHPGDRLLVRSWCVEYRRHCYSDNEKHVTLDSVKRLYDRIAAKDSTKGEEKIRIFFNTYMTIKAYCKGIKDVAFSDAPESVLALIDPVKAT